jgi:hypothetical protein
LHLVQEAQRAVQDVVGNATPGKRGPKKGATNGLAEYSKAEHERLKVNTNTDASDFLAKPGQETLRLQGASPVQLAICQRWSQMPAEQQANWKQKAERSNAASDEASEIKQLIAQAGIADPVEARTLPRKDGSGAELVTWVGDNEFVVSQSDYASASATAAGPLGVAWRQKYNTPVGSVMKDEGPGPAQLSPGADLTDEAPYSCYDTARCLRHSAAVHEVGVRITSTICSFLKRSGHPDDCVSSLWQLQWTTAPSSWRTTEFVEYFVVAHALLNPFRVIVLPLLRGPSEGLHRLGVLNLDWSFSEGRFAFATIYEYVAARNIPWAHCAEVRLACTEWSAHGWSSVVCGRTRAPTSALWQAAAGGAGASATGETEAGTRATQALAVLASLLAARRPTATAPWRRATKTKGKRGVGKRRARIVKPKGKRKRKVLHLWPLCLCCHIGPCCHFRPLLQYWPASPFCEIMLPFAIFPKGSYSE